MPHRPEVNLLLVEDNQLDVKIFRRALNSAGLDHPIQVAGNGVEALAALRGEGDDPPVERPNVVLLDINMPRMNGLEFLRELRADPELRNQVVFVLSTSDAEHDRERVYEYNVAGYLLKCSAGEDFVDTVRMLGKYMEKVRLPLH
ncbi:response regulator [Aquicoccus sp. SCR17]|nr:response regulator [Carideicomes alvinocaridis]